MNATDLAKLGITGIDPTKLSIIMQLAQELGRSIDVDREELQAYYPEVDSSFYLPSKPLSAYVGDQKMLRGLTTPNSERLARLVGAR